MIAWALETLIATTALMLLVLAIRRPVRRAFGPAVGYALWAIPALRMVMPPLPAGWRGQALPVLPVPEPITLYLAEPVMTVAAQPEAGIGWPAMLVMAWAVGAAGFALWHVVSHGRFVARVRRSARSVRTVAEGRVAVIETPAAAGPLAFGVVRKYVAFPCDFAERYDPLERDLALAHELGHHARGDLLANWAALVVLALHWFNPVAWAAFRAFRADQEMACDALVLANRAPGLRHAYGRAIVKSAHGGAVSAACHLHTVNEIKGRLRMLSEHTRTSRPKLLLGAGAVGSLLLGGLGLTASGTQAAERIRTTVETTTGVDIASIDLPKIGQVAAPAAPVAPAAPATPATPAVPAPSNKKVVRIIMRDKDGKVTESVQEGDRPVRVFVQRRGQADTLGVPPLPPLTPATPLPPEAAAALRDMPTIVSASCGGTGSSTVTRTAEGGKRTVTICTDRIERVMTISNAQARMARMQARTAERSAARAEADARRTEARAAMTEAHANYAALAGLRGARRAIENNRDMSDVQRSHALSGIDEAIREVESKAND